ncbi:hypothetical protein BBJ28_00025626 [Nothophytophthora sp. Chile5]|nr:hypothetical protein BBJ28_00025626 [Nothophytophthora sp. Chile5]
MAKIAVVIATTLALTQLTFAHPGAQSGARSDAQLAQHQRFLLDSKRALEGCASSESGRKLQERAIARRASKIDQLRAQQRRLDLASALSTSHKSNLTDVTTNTAASELFGDQVKCVLEPEATQGPYYVSGELIRSDIREDQDGVDLYTELQIIDVNTCTPVENLYLDFWHCNATGVYSGIVASGNGDSTDVSNVNTTFMRGLSPTDADGLVSFTTTFPGHYTGRATHVHVLGSCNGTVLENNTYSGGLTSHVGQIFFDQDLITAVESTGVYATNSQETTLNSVDNILSGETATGFDPFVEYAYLGDTVEAGIFAWISIGVDMTLANTISAAGTLTADGGVQSSNGMSGGPPGSLAGGMPPMEGSFGGTSKCSTA